MRKKISILRPPAAAIEKILDVPCMTRTSRRGETRWFYIRSGTTAVTIIAPTFHAKERINYRETRMLANVYTLCVCAICKRA